jgi:predicted NBD/HSP70 family sugar kinase
MAKVARMSGSHTPPVARQLSVSAIMETILREGATSRATVAKLTGLSRQTTTQVMFELEREGWLHVQGITQGPVGRSAPTYGINPEAAFVLGIRLGGTRLQMALANLRGHVVAEVAEPTDTQGGQQVVLQIGRLFNVLLGSCGVERARVRLGVMGSPGVVDPNSGIIDIAASIQHFNDINVVERLQSELGLGITIENGVNLGARGEHWQGKARGVRNLANIALGTGVGMGIIADGQLIRGARGAAGEIAYLPLGGDPFDPGGFANGTFETAVGSAAIIRRYHGYGGFTGKTVRDIFDRLALGDKAAEAALGETARLLVLAISAVHAVIDPELVVLGGSIGTRPELVERVKALLPLSIPRHVPVEASALGNRATLIGALGQALNQLHGELFGVSLVSRQFSMIDLTTG